MTENRKITEVLDSLNGVILGKKEVIDKVVISLLANGHVLIEDVPGVGKTVLVKALSKVLDLSYGRIQFTPDLMPSDIIGTNIYNKNKGEFYFKKGPIFNQVILADEINRTSPKTQSSLLQAMEEMHISTEDNEIELKKPFIVLATQNPLEFQGTFPLPEAQLDRFLMKISIGYPNKDNEKNIIKNHNNIKDLKDIRPIINAEEIKEIQAKVNDIYVDEDLLNYITDIISATRHHPDLSLGASPRASIDLYKASKAYAYIKGRDYVIPDDVKEIANDILSHRIILSPEARIDGKDAELIIKIIIRNIKININ